MLVRTALTARGPILELGCGDYSTPVLAAIAAHLGVPFSFMSSAPEWAAKFQGGTIVDWETVEFPHADIVFLDNEQLTRDRIKHLPTLAKTSRVVVMHDIVACMSRPSFAALVGAFSAFRAYPEHNTGVAWNN